MNPAKQSFEKAIRYNPEFPEAYLNLGSAYAGLENKKAALRSYDQAEEIDRSLREVNFNRGLVYLQIFTPLAEDASKEQEIEWSEARIERFMKSKAYLEKYISDVGKLPKDDPTNEYLKEIDTLVKEYERKIRRLKKKLERAAKQILRLSQVNGRVDHRWNSNHAVIAALEANMSPKPERFYISRNIEQVRSVSR